MMAMSRLQFISDGELAGLAQMGSREACDELVRRFRPAVLLTARQIVDSPEAAQDVAQDAFVQAFRALPQLQDTAKFAGWLRAITRHRARRVARNHSRIPTTTLSALDDCGPASNASGPLDALLMAENEAGIQTALAGLAPQHQIVLRLFYYEQWPASRIADFLSLPLTTVKWRLREGRKHIAVSLAALLNEGEGGGRRKEDRGEEDRSRANQATNT